MTSREQLIREIEQVPDELVEEILDFCLFVKQRQQAKATASTTSPQPQTSGILDLLEQVKEI